MPPLLSGNGRHRRPRQAPNFVVAAGVTGAGLAIPLLGATAASAADNTTWDTVADCESGGLWSANEDNGYYGGLQLDQQTWEEYGGTDYAERPDLASRDQQITIAEKVLDAEGTDPFGDCAQAAGLSQDSPGSPDVDPDGTEDVADGPVAERPYPTTPSTDAPEDEGGAPGTSAPDVPDPGASHPGGFDPGASDPGTSDPNGSDGSASSGGSGEQPADEGAGDSYEPADPGDGGDSADRPSRGDGADGRDDAGDAGKDGANGEDGKYRVSHGDSLYSIADEEDVEGGWRKLYERNRDVVGSDPGLILPGQELSL
ncbi:transglycosylase family protein [Streptomyces winkii]|uniref:transglycosylase family protein n=1 Tax=Streptomyces winkii TaxID=3051178 RepID=UPI0028D02BD4|nr:transglycosylase family protein [Streptomyces sp. DSM 40971]